MSAPGAVARAFEASLGFRLVRERLFAEHAWLAPAFGIIASLVGALLEREHASSGAADRALAGAAFGIALPLVAYVAFASGLGRRRLDHVLAPIDRHGASTSAAALGAFGALALVLAACGAAFGVVAVLAARGFGDPLLGRDLFASAWIGALGGIAYCGWFSLGSSFGKKAGGRKWVLALDFLLGASSGALALPWPRSHLRNLLGGEPPHDLSQPSSVAWLIGLSLVTVVLGLGRTRR